VKESIVNTGTCDRTTTSSSEDYCSINGEDHADGYLFRNHIPLKWRAKRLLLVVSSNGSLKVIYLYLSVQLPLMCHLMCLV